MPRSSQSSLFVVSGPSGVGKTTLVKGLLAADPLLARSVSTTTRPARSGEANGRDYSFVDRAEFERMKARLETTS